ncbi:MAG: O-antigen ligase family protein [Candidatus Omnitrophota bacterium]
MKLLDGSSKFNLIDILFFVYIFFLPIMLVPSLPIVDRKIQYSDLIFAVLFIPLSGLLIKKKIKVVKTLLYIPLGFYLLTHILSMLNSVDIIKSLLEISGVIYLSILFFVTIILVSNRDILRKILISWMFALGLVLICGIIGIVEVYIFKKESSVFMCQYITFDRYKLMHSLIPRVISTLRSPDMLISYLVLSLGPLIAFYRNTQIRAKKVIIFIFSGALFFVAAFTLSRGILALLICVAISFLSNRMKRSSSLIVVRFLLVNIAVVVFIIFAIFSLWEPSRLQISDYANTGEKNLSAVFHRPVKFYFYKYALLMIKDHPFVGVGSGNFNNNLRKYYYQDKQADPYFITYLDFDPHSTYLGLTAEIGIFGLIFFLSLVALFLRHMFLIYRSNNDCYIRNLAIGIIASVIGILIQGLAMDVQNLRHLWLVFGLGMSLTNLKV